MVLVLWSSHYCTHILLINQSDDYMFVTVVGYMNVMVVDYVCDGS